MAKLCLIALALLLLTAACSGDNSSPASTATASPTIQSTPTEAPPPTSTTGTTRVPLTVWLTDAATGDMTTLLEENELSDWHAFFNSEGTAAYVIDLLPADRPTIEFSVDGSERRRGDASSFCTSASEEQQYAAGSFEHDVCQKHNPDTSPDGQWLLVSQRQPDNLEYTLSAENTTTGETFVLMDGLVDCGGCDAVFGPIWSPSGRYLVFGETGEQKGERVFLTDFATKTTRIIGTGNEIDRAPQWSPNGDILIHPSDNGTVIREDLDAGTSQEFDQVPWPARFDATGKYLYSPAFRSGNGPRQTTVADAATGNVLLTLDGVPSSLRLWRNLVSVFSTSDGILSALESAAGCDGTVIYRDDTPLDCIEHAAGATISPDGSKVALAVVTGTAGPIEFPGGGSTGGYSVYDVVIFDVPSKKELHVASGAVGDQAPEFTWSPTSDHLLIRWPVHSGI